MRARRLRRIVCGSLRGKKLLFGLTLALTLGLAGCGDEPTLTTFPGDAELNWIEYGPPETAQPQGSYGWDSSEFDLVASFALDGKAGGTFTLGNATLQFPRNVVEGQFTLTIAQPQKNKAIWEFSLDPPVVGFDRPVTLIVDYNGHSYKDEHSILWLDESKNVWIDIGGRDYPNKGYCTVDLHHFSTYGVTDGTAGWD